MKLVVVSGWTDPTDVNCKVRPAVVLGMVNGRVAIAPCTTTVMRTGQVVRGGVLLTNKSPAFKGSGFHKEEVVIWVRKAALIGIDSGYLGKLRQIGVIDTELDKRFRDNLAQMMREYDLHQGCCRKFDR